MDREDIDEMYRPEPETREKPTNRPKPVSSDAARLDHLAQARAVLAAHPLSVDDPFDIEEGS